LVANATTDDGERDLYNRWVNSRKVDGFILNRIQKDDWRVTSLAKLNIPFAALGKSQDRIHSPCILVDGTEAYLNLVRHIQANGFTRFAFIGGPDDLMDHIDRLRWFKSALKKCGLQINKNNIVSTDISSTAGYESANTLFSRSTPPDAVFCVNDETAFGVLHAAHEHGFAIGTDIAIAGFEGVQDAKHTQPPLTTLDIPIFDIARQLVNMLLKIINREVVDSNFLIKPELLIRASTGGQLS
jgi:DNA-binding LacI/PurR family transcriptional regulator